MRVLHVLEAVGGGTMRHLEDLVTHVDAEHHIVCPTRRTVELSHPDPAGTLARHGARVHPVAMSRSVHHSENARAVRSISALIDEIRPDVVHAHASVAGALARVAARRRVPVVWSPHAVHDRRWALMVERGLRPLTDVVVTLSHSERRAATDARVARDSQIRVIPNGVRIGVDQPVDPIRDELGIPADAPVIGFIGRLSEQKDPLTFVRTCARVLRQQPLAHVVMVGSGHLAEQVLAEAAATLPAGHFHHVVRDAGADSLLGNFDVLLTTSTYEGGPYLPLEAMQVGVPVVATRCAGLQDYVLDGVSGLTAGVGDCTGLADAVVRLLTDLSLRDELVRSAWLHVAREHDVTVMAQAYVDLYSSLAPAAVPAGVPMWLPLQPARAATVRMDERLSV